MSFGVAVWGITGAKLGANALLDFGPTGNQTAVATYGNGIAVVGSSNTGWSAKAIVLER